MPSTPLITERLAQIERYSLKHGGHSEPDDGEFNACVMEAVAFVAGEPWSDAPECACPVITAFCVSWNDSLRTDADRDRLLKPLIPLIVGTRSTPDVERRRSLMAADWLVRVARCRCLAAKRLARRGLVPSLCSADQQDSAADLVRRMCAVTVEG